MGAAVGVDRAVLGDGPPRAALRPRHRLRGQRRRGARGDGRDRDLVAPGAARRDRADRLRQRLEPAVALHGGRSRRRPTGGRRRSALVVWGATVGAVIGPNLVAPAGQVALSLGLPELAGAVPRADPVRRGGGDPHLRRSSAPTRTSWPTPRRAMTATATRRSRSRSRSVLARPRRAGRHRRAGRRPVRDGPDHDDDPAAHGRPRPQPRRGRRGHQRPHVRDVRAVADLRPADRPLRERAGHPGRAGDRGRRVDPGGRGTARGRRDPVRRPVPARLRLEPRLRRRVGAADPRAVAAPSGPVSRA